MKKRFILTSIVLSMSLLFNGCSKPEPSSDNSGKPADAAKSSEQTKPVDKAAVKKKKITFAHIYSDTHSANVSALHLKEKIETAFPGKYEVNISSNAKLGAEKDLVASIQSGNIEFGFCSGTLPSIDPIFTVLDTPYLLKDYANIDAILDGEVGKQLLNAFDSKGLHGLAWWENGMRKLSANKEIKAPAELKDIKLRTMQNKLHIDYFTAMGATVMPLAFSQVYQSLKDGTLDAQENPFSNIVGSRFYEAQKFVIGTDHVYGTNAVIVSQLFWKQLDDADKKKFTDIISAERLVQRKSNRDQDKDYIDTLAKNNVKYITLTEAEKMVWKKSAEAFYPQVEAIVGKELFEKVKKAGGYN